MPVQPTSHQIVLGQDRTAILTVIRELGSSVKIARAAGLDPYSADGKSFRRSVERFRDSTESGGQQRHTRMSERNLALLETAAARRSVTARVTVEATISRSVRDPGQRREFTQQVDAGAVMRGETAAGVMEAAPIPIDYYGDDDGLVEVIGIEWS